MARPRTISICALNIKVHPHSPEHYADLLRDVFRLNRAVEFRANHYAMLGTLHSVDRKAPEDGMHGHLFRFLDFDRSQPWLNLEEHKAAEEKDLRAVRIPEHLKPNLLTFEYLFLPKHHRFFFECKSGKAAMSPASAKKIVDLQFKHPEILKKYGDVDVIVEPAREQLERIFAIPKLTKLHFIISRPNPDDQDEFEARVLRRLNIQNAARYEESLTSIKGHRLQPDEETKSLATVASSNGVVEGYGKDAEGRPIRESTVDHPLIENASYNPEVQTSHGAFVAKAREMLRTILGR